MGREDHVFDICAALQTTMPRVRIVDAGAAEHRTDPYVRLSEQDLCEVIGFEPNQASCDHRNATARPRHRYLPYALGDGTVRRFHECEDGLASSFYPPNMALIGLVTWLGIHKVAERDIATHRLDDIPEVGDVDYLKLDVQGAELDILRNAAVTLARTLVVHTEVSFVPIYEDQPLFADVDVVLRQAGFWLHGLKDMTGALPRPLNPTNPATGVANQLLWADAVYVRNFLEFESLPPEKLLKLALILHEVYQSWGLAAQALLAHERQTGSGLMQAYLQRLHSANLAI